MVRVAREENIFFKLKEAILNFLNIIYMFVISLFVTRPQDIKRDGTKRFSYNTKGGGSGPDGGRGPSNRPRGSTHTLRMGGGG